MSFEFGGLRVDVRLAWNRLRVQVSSSGRKRTGWVLPSFVPPYGTLPTPGKKRPRAPKRNHLPQAHAAPHLKTSPASWRLVLNHPRKMKNLSHPRHLSRDARPTLDAGRDPAALIISRTEGSQSTAEQSCFASSGTISAGLVPASRALLAPRRVDGSPEE